MDEFDENVSQELYQINCFDKLLVRLFRQQLILLFCETLNVNFFLREMCRNCFLPVGALGNEVISCCNCIFETMKSCHYPVILFIISFVVVVWKRDAFW